MIFLYEVQYFRFAWAILPSAILLCFCGYVSVVLYRIFLHPLSAFPGPRKAAATGWYHTYYDVWKEGSMTEHVVELHRKYGRIVRIGPNTLHFSNPTAYQTIYNNHKILKDPWHYAAFDGDGSVFGAINPHIAKNRRDVLGPLFSQRTIKSMQGLVAEKFDILCEKLGDYSDSGESVDISAAIRSATIDIIMTFCFAQSMQALDYPGFMSPVLKVKFIVLNTPQPFLVFSNVAGYILLKQKLETQVDNYLSSPSDMKSTPHPIIYHRLLDPNVKGAPKTPPKRKSLLEEAQTMLFAGADTVAITLSIGIYNILNNPTVNETLLAELRQAWPNLYETPTYEDLEKLPYLTAVIKESLRAAGGVVALLSRVIPDTGMMIDGEYIPGGTIVAMNSVVVHGNEDIFPNSNAFIPERWLGPDAKELERYLVSFSKGQRQCLGINLGYCELYLGLARIFRRFELKLNGTTDEDMKWKDYFVPLFEENSLNGFFKRRTD